MGTPEIICRSLAGQFTTVLCLEVVQTFTLASLHDCILPYWTLEPGGTQLKMGYSYVPPLRPLLHALFPKTAISEFFCFSSSRSYIHLKSHFWKICISKPQNWREVKFLCLTFGQVSVSPFMVQHTGLPGAGLWCYKPP